MSSTFVHYSTPSSLPSDYALLSRYAAARNLDINTTPNDNDDTTSPQAPLLQPDDEDRDDEEVPPRGLRPPRLTRRQSFPTSFIRPINPTMAPLPDKYGHRSGPNKPTPTENTPLLAPLVPRIPEDVDEEDLRPGSDKRNYATWEEIKILSKYTLPVFG